MIIYKQLAQQPDPDNLSTEQCLVGVLDLLKDSVNKRKLAPLLWSSSQNEQEQPSGLLGKLIKEELGNG